MSILIESYEKKQLKIQSKLELLKNKLSDHNKKFKKNNTYWGYLGDMEYIESSLDEILKSEL